MVIPTNYNFHYSWSSWLKTAFFTTVFALLHAILLNAQTCTADAGTLSSIEICFQRTQVKLDAIPQGDTVVPNGYQVLYVLTRGDDLIVEAISDNPSFTIDQTDNGLFTIHTLVFDSTTLNLDSILIGRTTGFDVNDLLIQGGGTICGSLDTVGARVRFGACESDSCSADAGRLAVANTSDSCFVNGRARLVAQVQTAPVVPAGYSVIYVLTSGSNLVIQQVNDSLSFNVDTTGRYTIHTLVYDTATLDLGSIAIGQTTGAFVDSLFIQGGGSICGSLDVRGAVFNLVACDTTTTDTCAARAGTVRVAGNNSCIDSTGSATLTAIANTDATVPAGFARIYVLTSGDSLKIEQEELTPTFTVDAPGSYRIHSFVYDTTDFAFLDSLIVFGRTLVGDVLQLSVQGGGTICAALDTVGALFNVVACDSTGVDSTCNVSAGRLTFNGGNFCIDSTGSTTLTARVQTAPTVPAGYSVVYVLTSSDSLIIEQAGATPSFDVDTTGRYTIHTLVYDSTTLNLGTIVFGTTTGVDVIELLTQGGGEICGALDATGVRFDVTRCVTNPDSCVATSGVLRIANEDYCLGDSTATLEVTVQTAPNLPNNYVLLYVLTSTDSLIIEAVDTIPSFDVDTTGRFRIHAFVFDSTEVNLADTNLVRLGETSALTLLPLLVQGGGTICAVLDATGVIFDVVACDSTNVDSCAARAGTVSIADSSFCFRDSSATLTAVANNNATVPPGFVRIYVLTSGDSLKIEQEELTPSFTVDAPGRYRIHSFVYDTTDFAFLDSLIVFGETLVGDVLQLSVQGGGTICAALDTLGAIFDVVACDSTGVDSCNIDLGVLSVTSGGFCIDSTGSVTLTGTVVTLATIPTGYSLLYVLTSGDSLVIENVSTTPSFTVDTTGRFTIHTLVYDSTTLDLDSIEIGTTTGVDVIGLLTQGGGEICGALDAAGLAFNVIDCDDYRDSCIITAGGLRVVNEDFCFGSDSTATLTAAIQTVPNVGPGFALIYVLTSGDSLKIEQEELTPTFTVDAPGRYRIHAFVYDTTDFAFLDSLIVFGETLVGDVLSLSVQGGGTICAALDTSGVIFDVIACDTIDTDSCAARAGTVRIANNNFCFNDSTDRATLTAVANADATVPPGFVRIYVLTSGDSLKIEQEELTPSFTVDAPGRYRIHSFVYDTTDFAFLDSLIVFGQTLVSDVLQLSVQGGGTICAALDASGVIFDVIACDSTNTDSCAATAGTVRIANNDFCFEDSSATLTAAVQTAATIPAGYQRIFVLTATDSLIIKQVSATPTFTVDTTGRYRIHPLVYDSTTLDLSIVQFDTTTAAAVNALLIQGGGDICAALDVNGVIFDVVACSDTTNVNCDNLSAGGFNRAVKGICVNSNFEATLLPERVQQPVVPAGYQVIYLLASGANNLVIEEINDTASFTVNTTGRFTVLTFVYNPNTFDLGDIDLGETTVNDLESQLLSEGGSVCGALDAFGSRFEVRDCACGAIPAILGYTGPGSNTVCISPDFTQFMSANVIRRSIIPSGYQVIYVLTSGNNRVIQAVSNTPIFGTRTPGTYYIHTLVYNPATLDLDQIEFGVTRAAQINALLRQGGGTICAGLEINGLKFTAKICSVNGLTSSTNLYPNPANEYTVIALPPAENVERITITLVDYNGTTLKEWKLQGGTESANLDLSSVLPGSYFVRVMYDNEITAQKPIVKIR